jgi:hypothetical protein
MAISYNVIDIRGVAAEPIIEEILFENATIDKGLVTFETDIKAETIFTETLATAVLQAYTSGVPTSAGSLTAFDAVVTPVKVQFYQEFDPNTLRFSRFKRDMKAGAFEMMSGEFERLVIAGLYAKQVSLANENEYWLGVKAATKAAIAGLTPGSPQTSVSALEQAQIAALSASQVDGVLTKFIYNSSNQAGSAAVGGRIKVAGTAISASNIKVEYDKIYQAVPAVVLNGSEQPLIYAPRSHKQFIIAANNVTSDFKKPFDVSNDGSSIFFNGLQIVFVPVPEKIVIVALKSHLVWCTDLVSDLNKVQIDKIALNREDMFIKNNMTLAAHVANQRFNVFYAG